MDIKIDDNYYVTTIGGPDPDVPCLVHRCGFHFNESYPYCLIGFLTSHKTVYFWQNDKSIDYNCGDNNKEIKNKFKFMMGES